jgi:hypothetical protein
VRAFVDLPLKFYVLTRSNEKIISGFGSETKTNIDVGTL